MAEKPRLLTFGFRLFFSVIRVLSKDLIYKILVIVHNVSLFQTPDGVCVNREGWLSLDKDRLYHKTPILRTVWAPCV